jgi:hypothetical protein
MVMPEYGRRIVDVLVFEFFVGCQVLFLYKGRKGNMLRKVALILLSACVIFKTTERILIQLCLQMPVIELSLDPCCPVFAVILYVSKLSLSILQSCTYIFPKLEVYWPSLCVWFVIISYACRSYQLLEFNYTTNGRAKLKKSVTFLIYYFP